MEEATSVAILSALAQGVNPMTGEVFSAESPYPQERRLLAEFDRGRKPSELARDLESDTRRHRGPSGAAWTVESG